MSDFHVFYLFFYIFKGIQDQVKLANFKKNFIFSKYHHNPLTYIRNVARRPILKKLCRAFKISSFLAKFGQKWQKIWFFVIKMVKNIIFGWVSWNNHYARSKAYTLVNSQKKLFLKLGNFTTQNIPLSCIYKIYILRISCSCQNFKMKLPNFKNFLLF